MKGGVVEVHKCRLLTLLLWLCVITQRETGVLVVRADCIPTTGCAALAYYRVRTGDTIQQLTNRFQINNNNLQTYNKNVTDVNVILAGTNLFLPFQYQCISGQLVHPFSSPVQSGDTLRSIMDQGYQKLTTLADVTNSSNLGSANVIIPGTTLSVHVKLPHNHHMACLS